MTHPEQLSRSNDVISSLLPYFGSSIALVPFVHGYFGHAQSALSVERSLDPPSVTVTRDTPISILIKGPWKDRPKA